MTTAPVDRREAPPEIVDTLLAHLAAGTTDLLPDVLRLDPGTFSDLDVQHDEIVEVFGRVPMIAAHTSELANAGDYVAKKLPRDEVVIIRQTDGSVKTFLNMCRHRGGRLIDEETGHCRRFSCPYHGWSYGTDGTLVSITYPETFGEVDCDSLGLVELPTEECHGFIWVIDDPDATIDVSGWLGPEMEELISSYRLDTLVSYQPKSFDEPMNWKVMHDAFLDGYHIKFAHPQTAAKQVHTNVYFTEERGRHWRFASPRKTIAPWLDGTAEGRPSLANIIVTHFISPNCTLLQLDDNFQVLTFYPVSDDPFESRMEMRVLVPRLEDTDMSEEQWTRKWDKNWNILSMVLTGEDFPILRDIQKGYANAAAPGALLGRNEVLNQAFHRDIQHLRSGGAI